MGEPTDDDIEKVRFLSEWFRNMAALEFDDPNNDIAQVIEAGFAFDDPDLAALQVEALERVRFCRQALEALCADRIDFLAGPPDP